MIQVLYVLIMTSMACSILGPFIILRDLSMVADALSHSVLLGIVIAFMIIGNLESIWLTVGAALFGLLTVYLVELLSKRGFIKRDDALGIVFPMFFSLAVVIISKFFRNAHIDVDIVLMGNPLFAPFVKLFNLPKSLVMMGLMFIINGIFVFVYYKKLKMSSFDREYAQLNGVQMTVLFYALMTLTSLTCVLAFDSVGAILVISFFVTPAATAHLLSKSLGQMIILTLLFGIISSTLGYALGLYYNVSISGMCSFVSLLLCLIVVVVNQNGVIYRIISKIKNKNRLMHDLVLIHIYKHTDDLIELGFDTIHHHLNWKKATSNKIINELLEQALIEKDEKLQAYLLTPQGYNYVRMLLG